MRSYYGGTLLLTPLLVINVCGPRVQAYIHVRLYRRTRVDPDKWDSLADQGAPGACPTLPPSCRGSKRLWLCFPFFRGSGESNTSPPACVASTLSTGLSPQALFSIIETTLE